MSVRGTSWLRIVGVVVVVLIVVGLSAAAMPLVKHWLKPPEIQAKPAGPRDALAVTRPTEDSLNVPLEVASSLGLKTTKAVLPTDPRPLPPLPGTLALISNHLARVHSRFAGEVVEIGKLDLQASTARAGLTPGQTLLYEQRKNDPTLRFGDEVKKADLLAVVWSKDLGEKKSELVDAISKLTLDQRNLKQLEKLFNDGSTPERTVREAERTVEGDLVAVSKAERTLRAWRLTDEEIDAIKKEAEHIRKLRGQKDDPTHERSWARVEVRSPIDGVILEKNSVVGDVIDTTSDLYKIADLDQLAVQAHAYEEDIPALEDLRRKLENEGKALPWNIQVSADPTSKPVPGTIDKIGDLIDPVQHTALISGRVDNKSRRLKAGQFVTATVMLPPSAEEVEIPTDALLDDGDSSVVFVQEKADVPVYHLRRVDVVRRYYNVVHVRRHPREELVEKHLARAGRPYAGLQPGEVVVSSGALEMLVKLQDLPVPANGH